ncbi:MAG: ribonuclease P protein component [Acidobacteria bacterium]|nr:ribonuclease P protein component [Acidobacteriota bacterium]
MPRLEEGGLSLTVAATRRRARLRTADFDRLYRQPARRQYSPRFLVLARPRQDSETRWGLSVKAALGSAVVRNRIKRRLREILRRLAPELPAGWDIVIQPREAAVASADFAALAEELTALLRRALHPEEK